VYGSAGWLSIGLHGRALGFGALRKLADPWRRKSLWPDGERHIGWRRYDEIDYELRDRAVTMSVSVGTWTGMHITQHWTGLRVAIGWLRVDVLFHDPVILLFKQSKQTRAILARRDELIAEVADLRALTCQRQTAPRPGDSGEGVDDE